MSEDTITISKEEYNRLNENERFLCALQAAGVDNWDGYDHAQDIMEEWYNE